MERETAMKILKELHGKSLFAERTALETLIPELKESEDKRIREALIRFHKSTIDIDGIKGDRIVAWLEKQESVREVVERCKNSWYNEGKIAGMAEGLTNDEKYQQGWHDALEKQCQTFTKKDVDDAYLKGVCDTKHELEKQGEQKPAVVDFNAKDWYVSKVDGKIHDMTYNPADKVEPRFKVKYAGSEYNVLEVKDIAGVTFYGIEDEPNHIDYVKAENCEIISGYAIKENGSPYPTKPAAWSEEDEEMTDDVIKGCVSAEKAHHFIHTPKEVADWLKSLKDRIGE